MSNLTIGEVYETDKIIPLMPELDPEWALVALTKVIYLPKNTKYKVVLEAKKREVLWYFVEIINTVYMQSKGWINSIALITNEKE